MKYFRARLRHLWSTRRLEIGPLLITTHERASRNEWNAFELGRDHGAQFGASPSQPVERHLRVVS